MPEVQRDRGGATLEAMKVAAREYYRSWRAPRLGRYVLVGMLCGAAYSGIDQYLDAALEDQNQLSVLRYLHHFVDLVLPLAAGALFGITAHFLQLRAARALGEAKRADELHARLTRVERDQAVWVVVASTLHEIKNPLHALGLLLAEVLELRVDDQTTRLELLERMSQQLGRVQKNVDALRGLSTRSAPRLELVDMQAMARKVAADLLLSPQAARADISVSDTSEILVKADPAHLRVILENLVGNALDAVDSLEHGKVMLDVERRAEQVRLRVSDNGAGVPPELRADLFEPLASSKSQGLGLGLPIARALARAMGGDVVLEGEPPVSSFVLSLPFGGP